MTEQTRNERLWSIVGRRFRPKYLMHTSHPKADALPQTTPRHFFSRRLETPLGAMLLTASPQGLCGAWFEGQKHAPDAATQATWQSAPELPVLLQTTAQLQAYFAGQSQGFDVPLDLSSGTAFQQAVWRGLLAVGFGRSLSYGQLALQLGHAQAARAVGTAVGRNPLSIIVPCHRILGARGQLTGYAGGLWRKQDLLKREGLSAF
jgi:methylated-DNA-[protein]-cysteine S-methyltransferase